MGGMSAKAIGDGLTSEMKRQGVSVNELAARTGKQVDHLQAVLDGYPNTTKRPTELDTVGDCSCARPQARPDEEVMASGDEGARYKVVRLLDDLLPRAAKPHGQASPSTSGFILREDSNDGHLWGEVAFLDPESGKLLSDPENSLPLDRPEAIGEYFNHIARKGFPLACKLRTTPRRSA